VNSGEGFGGVVGWGLGGGEGWLSGLDRDGAIAPCGSDEFLYAPTGLLLNPMELTDIAAKTMLRCGTPVRVENGVAVGLVDTVDLWSSSRRRLVSHSGDAS